MNRRGHLSTKIPNAKNRPAPIGHGRRKESGREKSPLNAMDEEMLERAWAGATDGDSSGSLQKSSKPWKGVVMTFTGVDNKARFAEMATNLGAVVEAALTVHVTHVIASGYNSAKYIYAVENRIPVLTPSWIQEAHQRFLLGEEWDDDELSRSHRLLPFSGLKIAMSGIEPMDKRKTLIRYIEEYGGEYSKDLDRSCTHLIASKYTAERGQSEKVKWALKELASREMAKRSGKEPEGEALKIIYEEWIWDCVGYGGRWKEDGYDANKIRRNGKVKPEDVMNGVEPVRAMPLAAADEAVEAEPAMVKKRKRGDLDTLVGDLVSATGVKTEPREPGIKVEATRLDLLAPDSDKGESSRSPSADPPLSRGVAKPSRTDRKPSMLHISRTASFGGVKSEPMDVEQSLPPTGGPSVVTSVIREQEGGLPQIFEGMRIGHAIDEECEGLIRALKVHGATFVSPEERAEGAEVDYLIVRLTSPTRPDVSDLANTPEVVTECWVEGCCFARRLLPLDSHIAFRPLSVSIPIPGIERFVIHLSSLSTENAVYMKRLVRALGGTLSLKMNRQTTHLVTGISSSEKVMKAREWGLKIVKDSWLVAIAQSGHLEDEAPHAIDTSHLPDIKPILHPSSNTPQVLVAASSQSSRALRPTPTHIDDPPSLGPPPKPAPAISPVHALSPPKASTHRLLNSAFSLRSSPRLESDKHDKGDSIDSKLSRTSSAPSLTKSREAHFESVKKDDLTALLQQFRADGSPPIDATSAAVQPKPLRRRPTSRLKSSIAPYTSWNTSPDSTAIATAVVENGGPVEGGEDGEDMPGPPEVGQESMRVYHRDPTAEREKKKLRDAIIKQSRGGDDSPAKRVRTTR